MDNRITNAKIFQIAMDPKRTHVVEQLSYDNNMLYLPLPKASECMPGSTFTKENKIVFGPDTNKETLPGHLNI
ncbi:MAG: hypothetical protein ACN4GW_05635 [Desulforhopalus sp.]